MTLTDYIVNKYKEHTNIDLSTDSIAMHRIKDASERALKELESLPETEVNLPFITADKDGPKHLSLIIDKTWNKQKLPDINEIVFKKHRIHRKDVKNQGVIYLIFAILIAIISGLLAFFMMSFVNN